MNRILLSFALFVLSVSYLAAQEKSVQEKFAVAINGERWFELNDIYTQYKGRSDSEFLKKLSRFYIHHFYNRPDSALAIAPDLLNNYQHELGGSVADVMHMFAIDLTRTGDYSEAANVMKMLCEAFVRSGDDSSEHYKAYYSYYREYKSLADIGNILEVAKPDRDVAVPFRLSGQKEAPHSMIVEGKLNGLDEEFVWDTGAGANVISTQMAEKYRLKVLDGNMPVSGYARTATTLAVADSLNLGGISLYNVPFYIVDTDTGNEEANAAIGGIKPVIGIPVMQKLVEFQIDMYKSVILIPYLLSKPQPSNICLNRSNNLYLRLFSNNRPLEMKFDTGMYNTCLSSLYYDSNKEVIDRAGKPFLLRMAGIGGVKMVQSYVLPRFTCRIGKYELHTDSVYVQTEPTFSDDRDGTLGFDILVKQWKAVVNLKDMFIEIIPSLGNPDFTSGVPGISIRSDKKIRITAGQSPVVPVSNSPTIETRFMRNSDGGITAQPVYPDR